MIREKIIICNKTIDTTSVAELIKIATKYDGSIWIEKDDHRVNAKSLLGVLYLNIKNGTEIRLIADGADAEMAITDTCMFLER